MTQAGIVVSQFFNSFAVRTETQSLREVGVFSNKPSCSPDASGSASWRGVSLRARATGCIPHKTPLAPSATGSSYLHSGSFCSSQRRAARPSAAVRCELEDLPRSSTQWRPQARQAERQNGRIMHVVIVEWRRPVCNSPIAFALTETWSRRSMATRPRQRRCRTSYRERFVEGSGMSRAILERGESAKQMLS